MPALSPAYGVYRTTAWEDLPFPAAAINPPGTVNAPDRSSDDGNFLFDSNTPEIIMASRIVPHSWKIGTDMIPHIHWEPTTNDVGNVVWLFEWEVRDKDEVFTLVWNSQTLTVAANGQGINTLSNLNPIDMSDCGLACNIKWRLTRLAGDIADTYPADAKVSEVDFHYQTDGLGSFDPLKK